MSLSPSSLGIEILTPRGSVAKLIAPPHVSIRPVSIGTDAEIEVHGEGIAPEHLFILLREGRLLATSPVAPHDPFKRMKPAMLLGASSRRVLSTAWTTTDLPCRVELGDVTVRLFWCSTRKNALPITPALRTKTPLPMVRPPPKRPLPPWTPRTARTTFPRGDDTTAARPKHDAVDPDSFDQDPTVKRKAEGGSIRDPHDDGLSDAYDIPTPAHHTMPLRPPQLARLTTPHPPPAPGLHRLPRVFVHTPPGGNPHPPFPHEPRSESSLFKIATRAVDAWNRWVDDQDATYKQRR